MLDLIKTAAAPLMGAAVLGVLAVCASAPAKAMPWSWPPPLPCTTSSGTPVPAS